jgi:hypothetical protein
MAWWATGEGDDVAGDWPADILDRANEQLAVDADLPQVLRIWQDALNRGARRLLCDATATRFVLSATKGTRRVAAADPSGDAASAAIADEALRRYAQAYADAVERKPRLSELRRGLHASLRVAAQASQRGDEAADIDAMSIEPDPLSSPDPVTQSLAVIDALRQQLAPLLQALARDPDGALAEALRPSLTDAERAFVAEAVLDAHTAYARLWSQAPPRVAAVPGAWDLRIDLAPAGMLVDDNLLSRRFPGGYRSIAARLVPHRVWARWSYLPACESAGIAYDGLVWLDKRWVWFPKPYRLLVP